jgi:DNA helicase-2/ATP-dependent DNA helicase PcrA
VVANPSDWVSLERIVNIPARGIGQNSWQKIEGVCRDHDVSILTVTPDQLPTLRPQSREAFLRFQKLLQDLVTKSSKLTPSEIVELILKRTGYKEMFNSKLPEDMSRLENIEELKSVTKGYDNKLGSEGLHAFLEEITLVSDQDDVDNSNNAVNLMTIHAAKGLEFDTVFICGMEDGLFPHSRSLFQPSEMEEERRLCYVALTRAKRRAYFVYAEQRTVYGSTQITAPSRFLNDLPKDLVVRS